MHFAINPNERIHNNRHKKRVHCIENGNNDIVCLNKLIRDFRKLSFVKKITINAVGFGVFLLIVAFTQTGSTTVAVAAVLKTVVGSNKEIDFSDQAAFNGTAYLSQLKIELNQTGMEKSIFKTCARVIDETGNGWSQFHQDRILYSKFFKGQTSGIYLDVGSNDKFRLSNSAFFDICMNWKGICVEPSAKSYEYAPHRSCSIAKKCAWSATANNLTMKAAGTGFDLTRVVKDGQYDKNDTKIFYCDTISATDLLKNYQPTDKYNKTVDLSVKKEIDYISLDIEGTEMEFLRSFPFNEYDVKVWSIEINKGFEAIDALMHANDYITAAFIPPNSHNLDAVYIKKEQKIRSSVIKSVW